MPDMVLENPVATVPAKAAVKVDRILINHLWLELSGDRWPANLSLSYFGRDENDNKVHATNPDGSRLEQTLHVPDIFDTGNADLNNGIELIMRGLLALYVEQEKAKAEAKAKEDMEVIRD